MQKFLKGMQKDPERVDQGEATYRDALNVNLYYQKGAIVNEAGNQIVANVTPAISEIIGNCPLEDGRIVIFAIDGVGHAISILSPKDGTYDILYRNDALNFQADFTIEALAKVNTQGDVLVYFSDNYLRRAVDAATGISYIDDFNPPRVFNVSKQERARLTSADTALYGNGEYNVDKLDLFLHAGAIPRFDEISIEDGGGVVSGTYHLALAYSDEDGNKTNYLVTSNAVHLVTAPEDTIPTETITGDPQGSQSKKSITWEVDIPIAVNYSHVTPVIIQRLGGGQNQASSEFAYELQDVKIPNYTGAVRRLNVTYTGLETAAAGDVMEVVVDHVRYETGKTLVQLENQLYLSNLQARGDIGYQRFANNITLDAVTETVERFDPRYFDLISLNEGYSLFDSPTTMAAFTVDSRFETYRAEQDVDSVDTQEQEDKFSGKVRKGYKDSKLFYKKKSYRRSEVYAFYISFVLKDGTETYAYHIPGRVSQEIVDRVDENSLISRLPTPNIPTSVFNASELQDQYGDIALYQAVDTQVLLSEIAGIETTTSFWENRNEFYPQTPDFDIWGTDPDGDAVSVGTLQSGNVRHHKMPSNKHTDWKYIGPGTNSQDSFEPNIAGQGNTEVQDFKMSEDISLLGIKLSNIQIPKFILQQVQGYKVYYAKRNQENKTILGQSIPVPAAFEGVTVPTMAADLAARGPFSKTWYMYGGIPPRAVDYLKVKRAENTYRGVSVFGFHDFNLLKNKHTLSGATHIDVQSILIMRQYRGGPNAKEDIQTTTKSFYMPDWLNSELGNNFDPDDIEEEEDNESVGVSHHLKIKSFNTSIMLASAYLMPSGSTDPKLGIDEGWAGTSGLSNLSSIYTLKAKSITYLPGHLNLKTIGGTEFHGTDYLYNLGGESEIAIGLQSGLPMLSGWNAQGVDTIWGGRFSWYAYSGYLNPGVGEWYNLNYVLNQGSPFVNTETGWGGEIGNGGWPATYLVNLCSIKSDVFKSFDEQKLVWTGYYKEIDIVDENTGTTSSDNYYVGAASDNIFGGDTYIGRYSFRSTSVSYGHSQFRPFDIPITPAETAVIDAYYTIQNVIDFSGLSDEELIDSGYLNGGYGNTGNNYAENKPEGVTIWGIPETWTRGDNSPASTVFYFMCESDDLLGFRHMGDQEAGTNVEDSTYFGPATANAAIFNGPLMDSTHMDHLLYQNNYSANQDIRVALPFPKKLNDVTRFPTRTIRSVDDEGSINDKYRIFQALEYKDIPRNRGDIFKLFTLGAILYIHTERSLFATKGKQELQLGDSTQAYVGDGNIFSQDPSEVLPTAQGYGGCDAQFANLSTRYGQFFMNRRDKKVYLYSESIVEVSSLGMEKWFLDHTPFRLEELGVDLELAGFRLDSPTSYFGFVATYDPKFKRIILTKRERVPTTLLTNLFASGVIIVANNNFYDTRSETTLLFTDELYFTAGGWTLSYYPEVQAWGSRHSYIPRFYASTAEEFYSFVNSTESLDSQIWEHSNFNNPGNFYNTVYNSEFEFISNPSPGESKVYSSFYFWADVVSISANNYKETHKHTSPGFDSFYVYNTAQVSGELTPIEYLTNVRRADKLWHINDFRDMADMETITTTDLVTGIPTVAGTFTEGVDANQDGVTMFTSEGTVNPTYINTTKSWYEQKRFVDHYLGIRLINDNSTTNLVYLYAAGTKHRKSSR